MHEVSSLLVNISILELYLFIVGVFVFFRLYSKMGNFWLFLPHLARGLLGLVLHQKIPKSHDIVKDLHFELLEDNVGFDLAHQKIRQDMQTLFV
jgi:hypothetical protein